MNQICANATYHSTKEDKKRYSQVWIMNGMRIIDARRQEFTPTQVFGQLFKTKNRSISCRPYSTTPRAADVAIVVG